MVYDKIAALAAAQKLQTEKYQQGCEWCVIDDCNACDESDYENFYVEWKHGCQIDNKRFPYVVEDGMIDPKTHLIIKLPDPVFCHTPEGVCKFLRPYGACEFFRDKKGRTRSLRIKDGWWKRCKACLKSGVIE